ncbi:MAG: SIMPL domain-containing protein [Candidatus Aquilonibacter sp.]
MTKPLALLAMLLIVATTAARAATVTHITVTGEGTIAVTPDQATVRAAIENTAARAQDAVSQTNVTYTGAVDAVVALGVARSDVTLAYYNFNYNPQPVVSPGENIPPGRYGYTVTRTFDVKVRDVNKAGAVVDALTKAGVTNIESVAFTASDPSRARSEATAKAMADARAKAQDAARAAGLHITGIGRITYGGAPIVQPMMRTMAAQAPAPTVFDQGSVNVTVNLTVVFLAQP